VFGVDVPGGGLNIALRVQDQLVTRRQLIAFGVHDVTIGRKIKRGEWQRVLPGVYSFTPFALSTEQRRISAALYAGPRAQLTGLGALHWHGFRHAPATDRIHVLVAHETRRRSTGFVVIQRTERLDEAAHMTDLYRVASPARAAIDACRTTSDLQAARAIMAEAVQSRFTSLDTLEREVALAGRSRTALARKVLRELAGGIRSAPEADLRDLVGTSRVLPPALWNARLVTLDGKALPTPDGWLPDAGIALEVDSRTHHSSAEDWARTLRRHNVLAQYGAVVLHFTPREIREEPKRVLRTIELTYRGRATATVPITVLVGAPS
jgi:hypothetical protein